MTLNDVIRDTVKSRLIQFDGNKTQAAKSLGLSLKTLYNRIHRWSGQEADREFWRSQIGEVQR